MVKSKGKQAHKYDTKRVITGSFEDVIQSVCDSGEASDRPQAGKA